MSIKGARSQIGFWAGLLLLNSLLFVPLPLLERSGIQIQLASSSWFEAFETLFVARTSFDLLRINIELIIGITAWHLIPHLRTQRIRTMLTGVYLVTLLYALYEAASVSLFQLEPVLVNQLHLLTEGLPFFLEHLHLPLPLYLFSSLLLILCLGALVWMLRRLTPLGTEFETGRASRYLLLSVSLVALVGMVPAGIPRSSPDRVVSSLSAKVWTNFDASRTLSQSLRDFDDDEIVRTYSIPSPQQIEGPDIYLIFIESYGSVLYKRPDWEPAYRDLLSELELELESAGWLASSTLSRAPMWGGGSWVSYTSALFGLAIENDATYRLLLEQYGAGLRRYPDLGLFLQYLGYQYVRVSSLSSEMADEKWLRLKDFYGIDRWLRYRDLDYEGPEYGWGPAPPDQFTLAHAQRWAETIERPLFFFTLTQNSHYPWNTIPDLVDDWRTLNQPGSEPEDRPAGSSQALRRNYYDSIEYELRMLIDFILRSDEDALFILVGDHQPPAVSRRSDGWETPLHIISREPQVIDALSDYGFEIGLGVESMQPDIHHAGLYSLLTQLMVKLSERQIEHPPFLPYGLPFPGADGAVAQ